MRRASGIRAGCLLAAGLAAVAGCSKKPPAAQAPPPTAVEVITVHRGTIASTVDVTGTVMALQDATLAAKLGGKVQSVPFREGGSVGRGSVVVQLQTVDYANQVKAATASLASARVRLSQAHTTSKMQDVVSEAGVRQARQALASAQEQLSVVKQGARSQERKQAESAVASAKASSDNAQKNLARTQQLYAQGAVARVALDADERTADVARAGLESAQQALSLIQAGARPEDRRIAENNVSQARDRLRQAEADLNQKTLRVEDIKAAEAGVRQAQASLDMARQALADSSVVSPIAGVVAERRVEPGEMVMPGSPLVRVYNPATIYMEATISEVQAQSVVRGQPVKVFSDAIPGKSFSGVVSQIYPAAATANRSLKARISLTGASGLKPGMFARARIITEQHKNEVILPQDAIMKTPDGEFVFIVKRENVTKPAPPTKKKLPKGAKPPMITVEAPVVHRVAIEVGVLSDGLAEIVKGLEANTVVVRSGQTYLKDGQEVTVAAGGLETK